MRSGNLDRTEYIQKLEALELGEILYNEAMKNHTSFKIGGPVDIMFIPKSEEEIINSIKFCRENKINYMIMGNGSNLLVSDQGIKGAVIKINDNFNSITFDGKRVYCQGGALLNAVSRRSRDHTLTGIEFANGIPGTIGGAITMNAGAYGGEMKDIVTKVRALDKNLQVKEYTNDEMNFRYRGSRVVDDSLVVLGVEFQLEFGDLDIINETMRDLTHKRSSKQPLELPSGGSTFKRPVGQFAGKLIEDSGLKGLNYGGAQVSDKHCGFVVNKDNASCKDVVTLISIIKKTVKDKFDVELEPEIKFIGVDM